MTIRPPRLYGALFAVLASIAMAAAPALAGPREQARRMHDRLVGTPPSPAVLAQMESMIQANDPLGAAYYAMDDPEFYRSSLKNWATPWTTVEGNVFEFLNDYSATVIGIVRDDLPFTKVLSGDVLYMGRPGLVGDDYSHTSNDHYIALDLARTDLSNPSDFIRVKQSEIPGSQLGPNDTAGVITTRQAAKAYFSTGTNRRMWRFTAINFLCRDMAELKDITRPVDRIRQDVNRSPGGDSEIFHNDCTGCHSGMDALAGAYAYYEWDANQERLVHDRGRVQDKNLINSNVFPGGAITEDNSWDNYWREGSNAVLGWRGDSSSGFGAKSLGKEVAATRAFSECQVQKVMEHLCFRPPGNQADRNEISRVADVFEATDYSMKRVFAEVATYCMGD